MAQPEIGGPNSEDMGLGPEVKEEIDALEGMLGEVDNLPPERRAEIARRLNVIDELKLTPWAQHKLEVIIRMYGSNGEEIVDNARKAVARLEKEGDTSSENYLSFKAFVILMTGAK